MNYTGYLLSEISRTKLETLYAPKYSTYLAHHITEAINVADDTELPEQPFSVKLIGYADDGKIEIFVAQIDGVMRRGDGNIYHLTYSLDKSQGAKPVDANKIVGQTTKIYPINIKVTPKLFTHSTEHYLKK